MKTTVRIILIISAVVCVILGVISSGIFAGMKSETKYKALETLSTSKVQNTENNMEYKTEKPEETVAGNTVPKKASGSNTVQFQSKKDFTALKKVNPDIIAWITVPGTNIDYPVCWTGDDRYLHTDISGETSVSGTIYLDPYDKPDFSCRQNLFYGHHMKDHSMFYDLIRFKDKAFFETHREIDLYTPEKDYKLNVIACEYAENIGERRRTECICMSANNQLLHQHILNSVG